MTWATKATTLTTLEARIERIEATLGITVEGRKSCAVCKAWFMTTNRLRIYCTRRCQDVASARKQRRKAARRRVEEAPDGA